MKYPTTQPRISIVTPSYNQVEFIEQTITSVLEQDYANLQYIVVDGQSTDGSIDIINKYRNHFDITIIEPDSGQSEAINKGLALADGDIVGWLNSDDVLLPGALEKIACYFMDTSDTNWLIGCVRNQSPEGELLDIQRPTGDFSLRGALFRSRPFNIPQPATFWRRRLLDDVGLLDTAQHYCMDFDLWCRLLAAGHQPKIVDDELATYRMHPESKTCSAPQKFMETLIDIEKRYAHHLSLKDQYQLMRLRGYQQRSLAINTCNTGQLLRKTVTRPWWLLSGDVRKALRAVPKSKMAA